LVLSGVDRSKGDFAMASDQPAQVPRATDPGRPRRRRGFGGLEPADQLGWLLVGAVSLACILGLVAWLFARG
jgi:hypothetical protein